jgi:hypothetical protein
MTTTTRRFLALATFAVALLTFAPQAHAARFLGCGFDPGRPSLCRFELAPGIAIDADSGSIQNHTDGLGFDLVGNLEIPTAGEPVVLAEARVEFAVGLGGMVFRNGTALMPFPDQGFLAEIEVSRQPMVSFGVNRGSELGFTGAPVQPDRDYFYFYGNTILEAGYGPISLTTPGGELSAVLDPTDPYLYIGGELVGLGDDKKKDAADGDGSSGNGDSGSSDSGSGDGSTDAAGNGGEGEGQESQEEGDGSIAKTGFAFSLQGLIPFTPLVTWGVEDRMPAFEGNVYVSGPIPLVPALTLTGETVFSIDPDKDGDHPFEPTWYEGHSAPDIAMGGNGILAVGVPFLKFLEFGFDLGKATAVGIVSDLQDSQVVFSGELGIDQEEAFAGLPFPLNLPDPMLVYGVFAPSELGSFIHGEGHTGIDPSPVGDLFGVELGPISSTRAVLDISPMGLSLSGTTGTSPIPSLVFAEAGVNVYIAPDGLSSHFELHGAFRLDGFDLKDARFRVSPETGVGIAGALQIENTVFGMSGSFGASRYTLSGEAALADAVQINATEALELTNLILQNQQSRAALADALADAQATLADAQSVANAAESAMIAAQNEVNKIQKDIDYHVYHRNSAYNSYRYWVNKSCKWYDAVCQSTRAANISYHWGRYTYHSGMVTTLSTAKTAALAVLGTAQSVFSAANTSLSAAVAGVNALRTSLDQLAAAAASLQAQLDALPDIEGELRPIVTATVEDGRLTGTVRGEWNGMQLTEGRVSFSSPAEACLTIPGAGELCSPL